MKNSINYNYNMIYLFIYYIYLYKYRRRTQLFRLFIRLRFAMIENRGITRCLTNR